MASQWPQYVSYEEAMGQAQGGAARPSCQKGPTDVVQASGEDDSWAPPFKGSVGQLGRNARNRIGWRDYLQQLNQLGNTLGFLMRK